MNILETINDPNLFRSFLDNGEGLDSWTGWLDILAAIYGLPATDPAGFAEVTGGRDVGKLPAEGFDSVLALTGRRSGKSRIAATIAAYEAACSGREKKLSPGEIPLVAVCSPSLKQSRIVRSYIRAAFDSSPILKAQVKEETKEGFTLLNGVRIEMLAGDWKTTRGFTLLAAIVDEVAFFGVEEDTHIKSDTELVRALKPALATANGKLIAISSPYARKGWAFKTWERHFGNNSPSTLVINAPSRVLNPTLPQKIVDQAMAEDRSAALAEYLGEWRDDVADYLPRPIIEAAVIKGRLELGPREHLKYHAFADLSGGRIDDAALALAHKDNEKIILDKVAFYKAPFDPNDVIRRMSEELKRWGLTRVTGDNYSAEFVVAGFKRNGIRYERAKANRSELYLELLPRIISPGELELLDSETLIEQLAGLERRTRSGGKDIIDHAKGRHDDLANAVAGSVFVAAKGRRVLGALF
ncbi:hypothetical protein [Stratiformator vulcanicus]|uniref:Terminase-like family protein n=1 Tax=Stratiformator vulcanicus TaxID=2527980 RepID=A0A517R5R3_9PLAN|nr:hypothetical protein [Stratiformator vulcanicus]QDT39228.1 hypothetical protein Pan189_36310 [Stratiformator vulcanicus]